GWEGCMGSALCRPRLAAPHLEAEGIADEVFGRAAVDPPELRLARAPRRDRGLGDRGGMEPQHAPADRQCEEQPERQEHLPGPARDTVGTGHPACIDARCGLSKAALAEFSGPRNARIASRRHRPSPEWTRRAK